MKFGPKYKIARKVGAPVFEKTQTQKFAMRDAKRKAARTSKPRAKSDYGLRMLEKQKARYSYGLGERQFSNYVKQAVASKTDSAQMLLSTLESRLDNAVTRSGLVSTRAFGRQIVTHGHVLVNGKKTSFPSFLVKVGDKISIREGSKKSPMFTNLDEKMKSYNLPAWLKFNPEAREWEVQGIPTIAKSDILFNIEVVLEFYSR
ncbi:MAG: 30S ribosomal protein S4 [Candidatus Taylorbacteria bacterium]|nr:30S ribosomal protein S4 [Candidatus Taylorbacteria bacterium]